MVLYVKKNVPYFPLIATEYFFEMQCYQYFRSTQGDSRYLALIFNSNCISVFYLHNIWRFLQGADPFIRSGI